MVPYGVSNLRHDVYGVLPCGCYEGAQLQRARKISSLLRSLHSKLLSLLPTRGLSRRRAYPNCMFV
jgi:hypothetical protein